MRQIYIFLLILLISCENATTSLNQKALESTTWSSSIGYIEDGILFSYISDSTGKNIIDSIGFPVALTDSCASIRYYSNAYRPNEKYELELIEVNKLWSAEGEYDFKQIGGRWLFYIYELDSTFSDCYIFISEDTSLNINETSNLKQIQFDIAGIDLGEQVDKSKFNIHDVINFGHTEEIYIWEEQDVTVSAIGDIIYGIEQSDIGDLDLDNIKEVVTNKFGYNVELETSVLDDYTIFHYNWELHGIFVRISKIEYTGDDPMAMMLSMGRGWDLSYENTFLKSALIVINKGGAPASKYIR